MHAENFDQLSPTSIKMGRDIQKAAYYHYRLQDEVSNKIHSVKSLITRFYFPQKCKIDLFTVKNKLLSFNLYYLIHQLYVKMVQKVSNCNENTYRLISVHMRKLATRSYVVYAQLIAYFTLLRKMEPSNLECILLFTSSYNLMRQLAAFQTILPIFMEIGDN